MQGNLGENLFLSGLEPTVPPLEAGKVVGDNLGAVVDPAPHAQQRRQRLQPAHVRAVQPALEHDAERSAELVALIAFLAALVSPHGHEETH